MFLLDTNVISELRKAGSGKANTEVVTWAESIDPIDFYLSAVTILELEVGVQRMEQRDPTQGAMLREWLDHRVLREFAERILPVDTDVARRCAALHVPDPRPERDALIAATALVHGMTVVTRDLADFAATGVSLLNPWRSRRPPSRWTKADAVSRGSSSGPRS